MTIARNTMRRLALAAAGVMVCAAAANAAEGIPAFPGAQGFGATTPGGRGGTVYEVTTLEDSGPGSFREAIREGNRIIVFRVAGNIELKSRVDIRASNITIAGQTAPGGGVCLKNYSLNIHGSNIVIRHLRIRLGDESGQETDALTIWHGARNIVLDHLSTSWSVDEALSLAGDVHNVTIQWCLIGEALQRSLHAKGAHGYGSLSRANGPVTWHHNLWAHNDSRNPRLGDNYGKDPRPFFDVRNNVMYDYGSTCSGLTQGIFHANYVGNYIRPGPSSKAKTPITAGGTSQLRFFLRDNFFEPDEKLTADNTLFFDRAALNPECVVETVDEPFEAALVHTTSAKQAYEDVLANVGAILPRRDLADARIIEQVRQRGGKMIDSQKEVGGWPELAAGAAPPDSDHDGMPDAWERKHNLNPNDASDSAADADKDGYTNIEEYLNGTDPTVFIDYTDPGNNVDPLMTR